MPIGDSPIYCVGYSWFLSKKSKQYDKYRVVKGFDECRGYASGKAQWEEDYPVHGLNFKIWDQSQKRGDSVCSMGIFVDSINTCFKYKIMKQACILVRFERDVDKNSYSWVYTGGCYANGEPILYEEAYPNENHNFRDVQFEVRMDTRESDLEPVEEEAPVEEDEEDEEGNKKETPQARIRRERDTLQTQADTGQL